MLRKQLEEQLGVKLADKKQLIRQEVGAAAVAKHIVWQLQASNKRNIVVLGFQNGLCCMPLLCYAVLCR
jgi:hypothetical protein